MRGEYRLAVYVLVTAIIDAISIFELYSLGFPNNNSSEWNPWLLIAANYWLLGRSWPGAGPVDPLYVLAWGAGSMFIIIVVIGETLHWLHEQIRKLVSILKS